MLRRHDVLLEPKVFREVIGLIEQLDLVNLQREGSVGTVGEDDGEAHGLLKVHPALPVLDVALVREEELGERDLEGRRE